MWLFTDIADEFDQRVRESDAFIEQWGVLAADEYLEDPGFQSGFRLGAIAVGHAAFTMSSTVGAGLVDVLRIGDGVRRGGSGYFDDALRALAVAGPTVRALRAIGGKYLRVDIQPGASMCTWVAATLALRLTSRRIFARVPDLAKAAGLQFSALGPAHVDESVSALRKLGARVDVLTGSSGSAFGNMQEVFEAARNNVRGLVLFSVTWKAGTVGHTLIARQTFRGVRIYDRTGNVVRNLDELESVYGGIKSGVPYGPAAIVHDAMRVKVIEDLSVAAIALRSVLDQIAVEVIPLTLRPVPSGVGEALSPVPTGLPRGSSSQKKRLPARSKFTVHQRPICEPPAYFSEITKCHIVHYYVTDTRDTLGDLAKYVYGHSHHWTVIRDANKGLIGGVKSSTEQLQKGMTLDIPDRR